MKKKNKKIFPVILAIILVVVVVGSMSVKKIKVSRNENFSESVRVENLNSEILTEGNVASEDEANLHFQTGGKLVYLPLKEGDKVWKGQTIAKLDTFTIEKQLTQALNNFKAVRDNFDQSQENNQNGVLQGQQKFVLETTNRVKLSDDDKDDVISAISKRILEQQQLNLDNAVVNVDLANYAIQLANLISPINGTIIHQDVNVANVNITPANSFIVANTSKLVFKSNLLEDYIQFVKEGDKAIIKLKGDSKEYSGVIAKIYPEKVKLANGQNVYKIDIKSADLQKNAKYGQIGNVIIRPENKEEILAIPSWAIENNKFVWIKTDKGIEMRTVVVGGNFGDKTQIVSGVSLNEQIVTDPKIVVKNKYKFY